jgi:DNA ligase-1
MSKQFKPMLASSEMPNPIRFPVYASYKLDGVRAMVRDGILVSRALKPIRNETVQGLLGSSILEGLDGELAVGSPTHKNLMQITTSGVMSQDGNPDFRYFVFDITNLPSLETYALRLEKLYSAFNNKSWTNNISNRIILLEQKLIENQQDLDTFEAEALALGYEGVICRDPAGLYKYGRATAKQGWMFKVKRFVDGEARIVRFKEEMHNANEAFVGELGQTKRSSHQDNKIGKGTLGAFECVDLVTGADVSVGTGFTAAQRAAFWQRREELIGKLVKYKHFPHGVKDSPRHPVFLGFRDLEDM